ncbi:hypothetical protein STAQ_40760 [Allostella sp. ATCC 35155]|nr:hypothetical protein STAQ_40760 [Stella sp. ATCC 35155]
MRRHALILTAAPAAALLAGGAGLLADAAPVVALLLAAAAAIVCVAVWTELQALFGGLRRLADLFGGLAADPGRVPPRPEAGEGAAVADVRAAGLRLHAARAADRRAHMAAGVAGRMGQILASLPQGVLVLTDSGLVSLANGAARRRFGERTLMPGTSVFDALDREDVGRAMAAARAGGRPVTASIATLDGAPVAVEVTALAAGEGVVLTFPAGESWDRALDHALDLHDRPPPAMTVSATTALAELPLVSLDTETTGLAPATDRIVSVAAVRLHGDRIFRGAALDRLVRPGVAIPPAATAVHGIDDAMVAAAPPFAAVLPELTEFIGAAVVLGHNVGFDLAVIDAECARAGASWPRPPSLCLFRLADALDPGRTDLDLDGLAARFGIPATGRHTALGDALLAAGIYQAMLPRLADLGIADWAALERFAARSRRATRMQAEAGW